VEVLHPECGSDAEAIRALAVRLTTINKVSGLLAGTDPVAADIVASVAESSKVPLVAPAGIPGRSTGGYVFHTGVAPDYHGRLLARFAAEQFQRRSVVLIVNSAEGARSLPTSVSEAFAREYRQAGGTIGGQWQYKTSAELKELAGRLQASPPDVVVLAGRVEDLEELRRATINEQLPIVYAGAEGAVPELQTNPMKNPVYLATTFVADDGPARAQEFARTYEERFHDRADVHAASAYDSARLLFEGLRRAKDVDGAKVKDALAQLKTFESVTGSISFDADHWAVRPLYVVSLDNGHAKTIRTIEPEAK
jgi:branched-chain amino acid transport system substrate-binding protein